MTTWGEVLKEKINSGVYLQTKASLCVTSAGSCVEFPMKYATVDWEKVLADIVSTVSQVLHT